MLENSISTCHHNRHSSPHFSSSILCGLFVQLQDSFQRCMKRRQKVFMLKDSVSTCHQNRHSQPVSAIPFYLAFIQSQDSFGQFMKQIQKLFMLEDSVSMCHQNRYTSLCLSNSTLLGLNRKILFSNSCNEVKRNFLQLRILYPRSIKLDILRPFEKFYYTWSLLNHKILFSFFSAIHEIKI